MTAVLEKTATPRAVPCSTQQRPGAEYQPVVHYEGKRVYLRPIEIEDEPLLRRWINDPRVWPTLARRGPLNACREKEFIEELGKSATDMVFGIAVRQGHRLIGTAGLHRIQPIMRSASFGISIGEVSDQGKGYGLETTKLVVRYGFEVLNLNRIGLTVYSNNPRAIMTYQKAGFVHEGCMRQALYSQGQYHDEYVFGILRQDWEAARATAN